MEDHGLLSIENHIDISCLHYVFAPRIQADMTLWRNGHNNHKIRTESNHTPLQLWHSGLLQNRLRDCVATRNIFTLNPSEIAAKVSEFVSNNNLTEPTSIVHVLPRMPLPLQEGS